MKSFTGFGSLDLTSVEAEGNRNTLRPGSYVCKITEVEVKETKGKDGRGLVVKLQHDSGSYVEDWINIHNRNEKAVEIGLARLKSLLVSGRHPNPDRPGDVKSLLGLTVGVHVEPGEDWTDKDGNVRPGGGKPRRSGAYFNPSEYSGPLGEYDVPAPKQRATAQTAVKQAGDLYGTGGDKIPF